MTLSPAAALLLGCTPAAPAAEPASPPATATATATTSSAPTAITASAPVASAAPEATAITSSAPAPAPLTEAEQREAERSCKPILDSINARKKKGGGDPLALLAEVMKRPPAGLPADRAARCADLLERGFRGYLSAAREVEAKLVLRRLGEAMAAAAQGNAGKLCPSSERPIPADPALITAEPYVSTDADWSTPAWKCLGLNLAGQQQRFQYQVRSDPQKGTFEVIARGAPGGDGRFIELFQRGTLSAKGIEISPVERR